MHKTWMIWVWMASLLFAFDASAEPVGFVASVRGDVEIRAEGDASFSAATLDRDVSIGDTVRTGPGSAVKILLDDDTTLTIGPDTELHVDSFVVGRAGPDQRSVLELVRGRIRAWIGEIFGAPSSVEMHTPTAVIGVKGTAYDVAVLEQESGVLTVVCVTHGAILVRPPGSAPGSAQEVSLGACVQIGPDGVVRPASGLPAPGSSSDAPELAQGGESEGSPGRSTAGGPVGTSPSGSEPSGSTGSDGEGDPDGESPGREGGPLVAGAPSGTKPGSDPQPRPGDASAPGPFIDPILLSDLRESPYQKPSTLERFLLTPPPVGLAPPSGDGTPSDPDTQTPVSVSLAPRQAPEDPALDGEDPLYRHDWYEDPIMSLSVRNHIPIVPDPEGGGSNLQLYRFVPFFNFDTRRPDVRIFVR